jgi:hypothetical protein
VHVCAVRLARGVLRRARNTRATLHARHAGAFHAQVGAVVLSRWDADVSAQHLGWVGRVSRCAFGGRGYVRVDACAAADVPERYRGCAARRRYVSTVVITAPAQASLDVLRVAAEV